MDLTALLAPVTCFVAAAATAVSFNVPQRAIVACGALGNVAFFSQGFLRTNGVSEIGSSFIAALLVALLAELMARRYRLPVICLSAPGVIPLVPGLMAFNALYAAVNTVDGPQPPLTDAMLVAFAISAALALGTSLVSLLPGAHQRWRNPVSPVDDHILRAGELVEIREEIRARVRAEAATSPPPGSD